MPESEKYPYIKLRITKYEEKILKELKEKFGLSIRKILEISGSCDCIDPVIAIHKKKQVVIPRNILAKRK